MQKRVRTGLEIVDECTDLMWELLHRKDISEMEEEHIRGIEQIYDAYMNAPRDNIRTPSKFAVLYGMLIATDCLTSKHPIKVEL